MALSPIKIFQSNRNPLEEVLAGGSRAVTGILDQAVQIGRDLSNKQMQQEQDLIGMRQRETALQQRRAENLQQANQDAFNFAQKAFQFDRTAGQQDRALDLRQEYQQGQLELGQGRLDLERQKAKTAQERERRIDQMLEERYGTPPPQEAQGPLPSLPLPGRQTVQDLAQGTAAEMPVEAAVDAANLFGGNAVRPDSMGEAGREALKDVGAAALPGLSGVAARGVRGAAKLFQTLPEGPTGDEFRDAVTARDQERGKRAEEQVQRQISESVPPTLNELIREQALLETDLAMAKKTRPDLVGGISQELASKELQVEQAKARAQSQTAAGRRAEESLQMRKNEAARERELKGLQTIIEDRGAFISPSVWSQREGEIPEDMVEAGEVYDADRLRAEFNYALEYGTAEEYVNALKPRPAVVERGRRTDKVISAEIKPLTEAQKAKRRRVWEYANKYLRPSSQKSTGAVSLIPGI